MKQEMTKEERIEKEFADLRKKATGDPEHDLGELTKLIHRLIEEEKNEACRY